MNILPAFTPAPSAQTKKQNQAVRALLLAAPMLALLSQPALAASGSWNATATDGNWVATGTENNWSTGAATSPGTTSGTTSADVATFATTSNFSTISIGGNNLNLKSITFGATTTATSAFTINATGAGSLLLTNGGAISYAADTSDSGLVQTINAPLVLEPGSTTTNGAYTITNANTLAGTTLAINGAISGGTTTGSVALTVSGGSLGGTLTGIISNGGAAGGLSLIKSGNGSWSITNANTYTGGTTLSSGTLNLGNNAALGTGAVTLTTGSLTASTALTGVANNFTLGGTTTVAGSSAITFTGNWTNSGTTGSQLSGSDSAGVTFSGGNFFLSDVSGTGKTLTLAGSGAINMSSVISNFNGTGTAGNLTFNGGAASVLTLNAVNTYTGVTTLQGGTVNLGNTGALNGGGAITFTGGTLQSSASNTTDYSARILNSTGAIKIDTNSQNVTLGTAISSTNTGGLTKIGSGTLTLSAANNYSGTSTLSSSGGTLKLANTAALGAAGSSLALGTTVGTAAGILDLATDTSVNAYNVTAISNVTVTSDRATAGAGINQQLGTLSLGAINLTTNSGANVTSGTGTVSFGATTLTATTTGTTTIGIGTGNVNLTSVTSLAGASQVDTLGLSGTGTNDSITGVISDGATGKLLLNKLNATSTWTISGANTFTGGTTLSGGTLVLGNTAALGASGAALTMSTTGAVLDIATDTSVNAYNVSVSANVADTINSDKATAGSAGITQQLGTLTLAGNGASLTFASGANVTGGTPMVAFGATAFSIAGTSANTLTANTAGVTLTSLTGSAAATLVDTLTLKGTSTNSAITGAISDGVAGGKVAITESGTGNWTLSGTNSYTGVTTASTGTLTLSGNNTATTGGLTVSAAGTAAINSNTALGAGTLSWAGTLINNSGSAVTGQSGTSSSTSTISLAAAGAPVFGTSTDTSSNNLNLGTGAINIAGNDSFTLNGGGDTVTMGGVASYTGAVGARITFITVNNGTNTGTGTGSNTLSLGGLNLGTSALGSSVVEDNILGSGNVTITGAVANGNGNVNALLYTGSGTMTLSGNNTYTGTTRILSATVGGTSPAQLTISGDNSAATGTVVISNGTVNVNSATAISATGLTFGLSGSSTGTYTYIDNTSGWTGSETYNPAVTAFNDFGFGGTNSLDMGSGAVALNIAASGTRNITLAGTNHTTLAFDGAVTGVTGAGGAGTLNVNGVGNTLVLGSFTTSASPNHTFVLGGSGNVTFTNAMIDAGTAATPFIYNGTGTATFKGANAFTLGTNINSGVVNYQNGTAFGANSVITAASGATVQVQGGIAGGGTVLTIGGAGATGSGATGALENVSGANSYSSVVALSADSTISSDAGTLTLSNSLALDTKSGFNVTLAGAGNGVIGGSINPTSTGFGGNLTKNGTGTWTLNADNFYTGTTTINGGALQVGNGGTTGTIAFTSGIVNNGTLIVNHSDAVTQGNQIPGAITGTGGFIQAGTGTTTLGANSYQGTTAVNAGTLNVSGALFSTGLVTVANGASLTGTGSAGFTTVSGGGSVALLDGNIGTLSLGSLTIGNATTQSALSFDIGSVLGSVDSINDSGALTLLGASGTTITIGNATGVSSLAAGNYALINYGGTYTGSLANLSLSTTTLDGKTLSLTQGSGVIFLTVAGAGATSTTYSLSTTAAASRILSGQSTTLTTTITNTGTGTADTLNYTGLGATGTTVSGGTTSGGPVAQSGTGTNTTQTFTSTTTGTNTINPTVGSATNATAGGSATLAGSTSASVDVVAKRVITNGATTNFGVLHSGAAVSGTSSAFTTTGTHDTTTDVTVAAGNGTDGNGVTLSGTATTFNGTTSSGTRTFGGTITNASGGATSGGFNLGVTGEGLTGEGTYSNVAVNYTAFVYTGQGVWNTNGGGSWSSVSASPANWQANGGTPGLDSNFTNTDSATFGSVSDGTNGATSVVTLDGDNPSLNAITFNDSAAGYKIAQGTGGTLTLKGNGGNAVVTDLAGVHEINAPVVLATSANVNVATGQRLVISGAVSGAGALNNIGAGATVLSNASGNSYLGGTSLTAGRLYVTNSTGSGTGSGAVGVSGAGTVLAGNGKISGAVTLSSNGSLYSGGVATGTPTTGAGTGMTLSSALNVNGANLVFALSNGGNGGTTSSPLTTSTYLSLTGGATLNFTGTDSITLVDLSNGGLSLRTNNAYLLVAASSDSAYTGLVTQNALGVISLDGDGKVLGVSTDGTTAHYTAFTFNQFGADGTTPLDGSTTAGNGYFQPYLYLSGGDLEVVPEPGTWALMIGGLALLIVIQRRRSKLG